VPRACPCKSLNLHFNLFGEVAHEALQTVPDTHILRGAWQCDDSNWAWSGCNSLHRPGDHTPHSER
jgi:hypothetical protein